MHHYHYFKIVWYDLGSLLILRIADHDAGSKYITSFQYTILTQYILSFLFPIASQRKKKMTKMNKISYLALGMVALATIMTSSAALTDESESHKIKTDVIGMLRGKINSIANGRLLKKEKGARWFQNYIPN